MILETDRLILRPWDESDAEECYKYAKDDRIGPPCGWHPHTSVEQSRQVIRDFLSKPEIFAIVLKETKLPIGSIGLHFDNGDILKEDNEAELGYWLGVPYWGQGIIPEASREMLRHAFEDLNLEKVWCGYYEGNEKSKRVQEKVGFKFQKIIEKLPIKQLGETRKVYITCFTKADWNNRS